jgi:hypothetical protein
MRCGTVGLWEVSDAKQIWHYLCHTTHQPEVLETVRARARFNSRPVVVFAQYSMGALFPFVGLFREACSGSS